MFRDGSGTEKRKDGRPRNAEVRPREHLTPREVERLIHAAGQAGRHRHRDRVLLQLMYGHGLRAGEAVTLRRSQVDLDQGVLHVRRLKNGVPSTHPLRGVEIRGLRRLFRESPESPFVFVSERATPLTVRSSAESSRTRRTVRRSPRSSTRPRQARYSTTAPGRSPGVSPSSVRRSSGFGCSWKGSRLWGRH